MRTIVLTRVEAYCPTRLNPNKITFIKDEPVTVDDDLADLCLESGQFMDASYAPQTDSITDILGIKKLAVGPNYVLNPKNTLDDDDLNGKRIMLRRNGGIGDFVFVAIIAQYIKDKFPKSIIWAGVNDEILHFATCFDSIDKVMPITEALRDEAIHACNYIVEFNGILGSEASNSEDNKDYFEAHWERAGLKLPLPSPVPSPSIDGLISNLSITATAQDVLERNKLENSGYAVLLLGTSNPLKRLTIEQLKLIASTYIKLAEKGTAPKIICIGGRGDRFFDSEHPFICVEPELELLVSTEIVRRSSVVIGADTGLMQLAGAIGIPTVSIWGPTDPTLSFSHYKQETQAVLTQKGKLECAPCRRIRTAFCPYYEAGYAKCMKEFDAVTIAEYAVELSQKYPTHENKDKTPGDVRKLQEQDRTAYKVAILLDNGGYYTGGGYYAWSLAKILAEKPRVEVTVITDVDVASSFVYARGDVLPRGNRLSVQYFRGDMETWDDSEYYDLVIGTPPFLGKTAVEYAKKHGAKSALLVYETPNYIKQYREGIDGAEDYWSSYKSAIKNTDAIWTISKEVNTHLCEWIPEVSSKSWVVKPTVNSAVADTIFNGRTIRRRDGVNVVIISRNVKYKQLGEAIKVIATRVAPALTSKLVLHVIGHKVSSLEPNIASSKNCEVIFHENLPDLDKWKLLFEAKAVVHPSEFEGFGIPIAEGLYSGATVLAHPLPVFKDEFKDFPTYYTDEKDLEEKLLKTLEKWDSEIELPAATARRAFANTRFTKHTQNKTISRCLFTKLGFKDKKIQAEKQEGIHVGNELRVAIVSPWNTQCGIADTTKQFVEHLDATYKVFSYTDIPTICRDEEFVSRCWDRSFSNPGTLLSYINEFDPNVVHIQHEHSLFQNEENFFTFLRELKRRGAQVIVTLHTYRVDAFTDKLMDTVDIVTTTKDQDGMSNSFMGVPLPIVYVPNVDKRVARNKYGIREDDFVVGTFGMWQEHKGFREFMDSYDSLVKVTGDNVKYVISGAAPPKSQYLMECRRQHIDKIRGGLFIFFEDYPPIEEVIERLSTCDALVFDYSVAHWSSASAAIRTAMMAKVPIVCSESPMFKEFENGKHVLKVPYGDTESLVQALLTIKNDEAFGQKLVDACNKYCTSCTPEKIARKWSLIYRMSVYGEEEED